MRLDLAFFVKAIESGMISALREELGYLKTIATFKGQLSREGLRDTVKQALATLSKSAPMALVCYVEGVDLGAAGDGQLAREGNVYGRPREWDHKSAFVVVVIDTDARGQAAQREGTPLHPGAYQMIADTQYALSGAQFGVEVVLEEGQDPTVVIANDDPLEPAGVEYVDRVPNATAYAVHFLTKFRWAEKDRRGEPVMIEEIVFDIDPLNEPAGEGGLPGVQTQT